MTMQTSSQRGHAVRVLPQARRKYSSRAFFLTLLAISIFTVISVIRDRDSTILNGPSVKNSGLLLRREAGLDADPQNEDCREIHSATDKCAFVKANCFDEEAGVFSYLTLYYCRLPQAQPFAFGVLTLWLAMLFSTIGIAASDFFCINLSTIANLLGMSQSMAGVTFLAFGNGSPDVFSTFAAMSTNSGSLALGELIGAASFITAVVAGSMAIVRPFKVGKRSFMRDVGFFTAAVGFSIVFLYDGKLYLWECATMVGFYIFYVVTVVFWHWWLGLRRRRRQRNAAIRSHYVTPGGEEAEVLGEYHDEEEGESQSRQRMTPGVTSEELNALEHAGEPISPELDEEDDDAVRERWLGELNSNMRLSRPSIGGRRNTHNAIRPSLVGALEFRAVLSSLKKSRNIQTIPINLRRYSDDPNFTASQQRDTMSILSNPETLSPSQTRREGASLLPSASIEAGDLLGSGTRLRAVSANGADALRLDPSALRADTQSRIDLLGSISDETAPVRPTWIDQTDETGHLLPLPPLAMNSSSPSPLASVPRVRSSSPERLALPEPHGSTARQPDDSSLQSNLQVHHHHHHQSSRNSSLDVSGSSLHRPMSPPAPFPGFIEPSFSERSSRAPSINLPPTPTPELLIDGNDLLGLESRPLKWWPYNILPSPNVLISTLFPTLYSWREKTWWERALGIVSAPSVFLLTVTLPIVESPKDDDGASDDVPQLALPSPLGSTDDVNMYKRSRASTITIIEPEMSPRQYQVGTGSRSDPNLGIPGHGNTAGVAVSTENHHRHHHHHLPLQETVLSPTQPRFLQSPEQLPVDTVKAPEPIDWNRWLIFVQTFTAPLFVSLVVWANMNPDSPSLLVKLVLFSLIGSLVVLAFLLLTTTPTRPPKWRTALCFVGFVVSIAWISTIANEVVGVLKALGVILNISDAILGLTIFAVGNSLGDLVADITVARLGYPVMALSACFGGPMLNILLGIGLSGCYITITGAQHKHRKHPDSPIRFKPYHVDISSTLVISGFTLLVTLVGLLVAVPARKWRMDRVIGIGLVGLWTVSTIGNVIAEVVGWGGNVR